jgi:hypothetical protein
MKVQLRLGATHATFLPQGGYRLPSPAVPGMNGSTKTRF